MICWLFTYTKARLVYINGVGAGRNLSVLTQATRLFITSPSMPGSCRQSGGGEYAFHAGAARAFDEDDGCRGIGKIGGKCRARAGGVGEMAIRAVFLGEAVAD